MERGAGVRRGITTATVSKENVVTILYSVNYCTYFQYNDNY